MDAQHRGKVWYCENCGEVNEGPAPAAQEVYDFENSCFDYEDTLPVGTPLDQIRKWLDEHVEKSTIVACNGCSGVEENDITVWDDAWECGNCSEFFEDRDEAESCCDYMREHRDAQIRQAQELLQRSGYTVAKTVSTNSTLPTPTSLGNSF